MRGQGLVRRHSGWPSDLEAAGGARALDSLLVRLIAHDDLICRRCGAPLWGAQERQGQAHQRGQEQHNAEVVADPSPDPEPVKVGKVVRREQMSSTNLSALDDMELSYQPSISCQSAASLSASALPL